MATKASKLKEKEIPLKVRLDITDEDIVYDITYRPLSPAENNNNVLVATRANFQTQFKALTEVSQELASIESDVIDMEKIIEVTPEEDDEYHEILREKLALSAESRRVNKRFQNEYAMVKKNNPDFNNLSEEYGKVSILELKKQVGGTDAKKLLSAIEKDLSLAPTAAMQISDIYTSEMKGK